jgi:hypothetical protein
VLRFLWILLASASLAAEEVRFKKGAVFTVGKREFNLRTDRGLQKLVEFSAEGLGKKDARGIAIMRELSAVWLAQPNGKIHAQILEISQAVANNHRYPMPRYVDILTAPFYFADALNNPVATKNVPSANDEPLDSTFWKRPVNFGDTDLLAGFGRRELPNYDQVIWNYAGPKKAGRNAGCELESGRLRIKVKFAELHSEPFTARIFHALGYNVMPTDYAPRLRLRYDKRFFSEFNSRPEMRMRVGIAFLPLYSFNLQNVLDPCDFIESAVLKDGTDVDAKELRNRRAAIEEQIDFLVTKPANVQVEPPDWQSIGPWDFGQLGHEDLRELRGAGVVAAWLGWSDSRYENTRLRVKRTESGVELKHFLSDLGGGMGLCEGTFKRSTEKACDFGSSFTRMHKRRFEIVNYAPIEDTKAFEKITADDARWMAAMLAEISQRQIEDALTASGFSTEEVRIYTEKLVQRREKLMEDLGLNAPVLAGAR